MASHPRAASEFPLLLEEGCPPPPGRRKINCCCRGGAPPQGPTAAASRMTSLLAEDSSLFAEDSGLTAKDSSPRRRFESSCRRLEPLGRRLESFCKNLPSSAIKTDPGRPPVKQQSLDPGGVRTPHPHQQQSNFRRVTPQWKFRGPWRGGQNPLGILQDISQRRWRIHL